MLLRGMGRGKGMKMHFLTPAIFAVLSIFLSAASGDLKLGQDILLGIFPFRSLIAAGVLGMAVFIAMRDGELSRRHLLGMLYIIGTIELILFTLQFFLAGRVTFLYLNTSETRLSLTRLRVPFLLTMVLGINSFKTVAIGNGLSLGKRVFHITFCVWSIILLAFIAQHRGPTIILVVSYIIGFILWHGASARKIAVFAVLIALLGVFVASPVFRSSVLVIMGEDQSAQTSTLSIRQSGHQYYEERLEDSPLFGFGVPNDSYEPAEIAAGELYNFFLVDNGIFGFAYELGLFGLIWLTLLYVLALKLSSSLRRSTGDFGYLQYFLFEVGNLYMGMHWFYNNPLPFMITLALLDYDFGLVEHNED